MTETYRDFPTTEAPGVDVWREWLSRHHADTDGVWLIIYKKASGRPSITYPEAVDEALCWGWIDSLPNKRDAESYYQYFSPRQPKSNWSKVNKEKVAKLLIAGRMAPPGLEMVELAKESGTWDALNDVDNLVVPKDLQAAFDADATAWHHWQAFPDSTKRGILEWIFNAKRAPTREKRIRETVDKASRNERANQYRKPI